MLQYEIYSASPSNNCTTKFTTLNKIAQRVAQESAQCVVQ